MAYLEIREVNLGAYIRARENTNNFNRMLKSCATLFHRHDVPIERIDAVLDVVKDYLHAEYNGYGDAFEKKGEGK
jgi:hypothetical protein